MKDNCTEAELRKMVETQKPAADWGVVVDNGNTYYIMNAL